MNQQEQDAEEIALSNAFNKVMNPQVQQQQQQQQQQQMRNQQRQMQQQQQPRQMQQQQQQQQKQMSPSQMQQLQQMRMMQIQSNPVPPMQLDSKQQQQQQRIEAMQQQLRQPLKREQPVNKKIRYKDTERMKGREISLLIYQQERSTKTGDEYSDDYYNIEYCDRVEIKQQTEHYLQQVLGIKDDNIEDILIKASTSNNERPAALLAELNQLKEGKRATFGMLNIKKNQPLPDLRFQPLNEQLKYLLSKKQEASNNRAEFEKENHVLGRQMRSDLRRPRELLSFNVTDSFKDSFNNDTWNIKRNSESVYQLILEVKDIHRVLKAKAIAFPALLQGQRVGAEWKFAEQNLRQLQDQEESLCLKLALSIGLTDYEDYLTMNRNNDSNLAPNSEEKNKQYLEQQQLKLGQLLWLNKGRKAVCKSIPCLLPKHHFRLLTLCCKLLVFFVCTSPDGHSSKDPLEKAKADLDDYTTHIFAKELCNTESLRDTTYFLDQLLSNQIPESLRAVMSTKGGAEIIRTIISYGEDLCDNQNYHFDDALKNEWRKQFERFMTMAETGIREAENQN